jgi:hypothetical protein
MTRERNFERIAQAWLELGPNEAPDRAVSAVLQAVETTPQVRPLSRRLPWRYPIMNRSPIAAALAVAVVIVIGGILLMRPSDQSGVGGASPSPTTTSPAASATVAASSPLSATAPSETPSVFRSDRYGYLVSIPALWSRSPATVTWDGVGAPANDAAEVDAFLVPPRYTQVWAYAAPTRLKLADYATQTVDAAAAEHPCSVGSQKPETDEPVTVGGEPARLLTTHCGILILAAVTIHNGSGVVLAFQDPNGNPSLDAEDRAVFLQFLAGVRFTS